MNLIHCRPLDQNNDEAMLTAEIVQRVSDEITVLLLKHPINLERKNNNKSIANVVLFRGCSKAPNLPSFTSMHKLDFQPLMMARTCIISGIGTELGFKLTPALWDNQENFIENEDTILADINLFIDDLHEESKCNFAFFHIKSIDEASHDNNFKLKAFLIEKIDLILNNAIGRLINEFKSDEFRIILTGDHSTLCRIGEHSCEPVPFIVSEPLIELKNLQNKDQYTSTLSKCYLNNNIGRFSGISVMKFIKNILSHD